MDEARLDHVSRLGYREKPVSRTTTTTITTTTDSLRVQCTYMYFCSQKIHFSMVLFYIKQTKSANIYFEGRVQIWQWKFLIIVLNTYIDFLLDIL